jgi:hypothetical protein
LTKACALRQEADGRWQKEKDVFLPSSLRYELFPLGMEEKKYLSGEPFK